MPKELEIEIGKILANGINEPFTPDLFDFIYDELTKNVIIIIKSKKSVNIHEDGIMESYDEALERVYDILDEHGVVYDGILQNPEEVPIESA